MAKKKATMSDQNKDVLEYMKENGSITALQAMKHLGVGRLAPRISELRELGYGIKSDPLQVVKANGKKTRVAIYTLLDTEPAVIEHIEETAENVS